MPITHTRQHLQEGKDGINGIIANPPRVLMRHCPSMEKRFSQLVFRADLLQAVVVPKIFIAGKRQQIFMGSELKFHRLANFHIGQKLQPGLVFCLKKACLKAVGRILILWRTLATQQLRFFRVGYVQSVGNVQKIGVHLLFNCGYCPCSLFFSASSMPMVR